MTEASKTVAPIVRFAPSPTGYLHIGGARTALFNWLFARGRGGKFLLRIEDTDRERNNPEAVAAILDGLKWMELDWDGEAVSQFSRGDRHREIANELLKRGAAYHCYAQPAEIDAARDAAKAEGRPQTFLSPWRDCDAKDAPKNIQPAVRLKAPRTGETVIDDQVQGRVVFPNKDLDDLIILRSDGNPTYNLAVVVDDHDMGVTHVVRGVDHLTNAARQAQMYQGMDWKVPVFAHVPLIHGPDGAKLSKRHGALGIEAYRAMGFLPVALRNYLVRLGWAHGNDEIMSREQLVEWFDLDGIGKSPSRFDVKKLEDLNGHYIRQTPDNELVARIEDILPEIEGGPAIAAKLDAAMRAKLLAAMPGLKDRAKTLQELIDGAAYLFALRPLKLEDKAAKLLDQSGRASNTAIATLLGEISDSDWQASKLEAEVKKYAGENGLKLGAIAQPLRAALTGRAVSPPIFDVLAVLGRDEALARLKEGS